MVCIALGTVMVTSMIFIPPSRIELHNFNPSSALLALTTAISFAEKYI